MNKEKKLLLITEFFPNTVQTWFLNSVEQALLHGYKITIVAYDSLGKSVSKKLAHYALEDKTKYYPPSNDFRQITLILRFISSFFRNPIKSLHFLHKLNLRHSRLKMPMGLRYKEIVRLPLLNDGYHLIHVHHLMSALDYLFLQEILNIPLVITFHGQPPDGIPKLNQSKMKKLFNAANIFLVNTKFAKKQLVCLGCLDSKIQIVPQGVDLDDFQFNPRQSNKNLTTCLTVSRLDFTKGHKYAIQAIDKIVKEGINIHYNIIGQGPAITEIKKLISHLNLNDHVFLLGEIQGKALAQQYQASDIFILPTAPDDATNLNNWHETQGVVIQEAQASGSIVIATKSGGIPECINEKSAFLVDAKDPDGLARAIKHIINNPDTQLEWKKTALKWVSDNFDTHKTGHKVNKIYQDVLMKSNPK